MAEVVVMACAGCAAMMAYEAYYSVVVFVPLVLVLSGPITRTRFALLSGLWFIGPFLNGLRMIWVLRYGPPQYEEALLTGSNRTWGEVVDLFARTLFGAVKSFFAPEFGFGRTTAAAAALVLLALGGAAAFWRVPHDEPTDRRRLLLGAAGAFAIMPITTLIYWPNPAHLPDPLRIFSVAALPGAIALACLLGALRDARWATGACTCAATLSILGAAGQREQWHQLATFQERVLGRVAEEMALTPATDIVFFDPEGRVGSAYAFIDPYMALALRYLFTDPTITVTLCHMAPAAARDLPVEAQCNVNGASTTTADHRTIRVDRTLVLELSGAQVIVVSAPAPHSQPLPHRVHSVLACIDDDTCGSIPTVHDTSYDYLKP